MPGALCPPTPVKALAYRRSNVRQCSCSDRRAGDLAFTQLGDHGLNIPAVNGPHVIDPNFLWIRADDVYGVCAITVELLDQVGLNIDKDDLKSALMEKLRDEASPDVARA